MCELGILAVEMERNRCGETLRKGSHQLCWFDSLAADQRHVSKDVLGYAAITNDSKSICNATSFYLLMLNIPDSET